MDRTRRPRFVGWSADVEERVGATPRSVDQLIDDDELARVDVRLQRPHRAGCDKRFDSDRLHRPDVRPVRHAVRSELVAHAVTSEEGDRLTSKLAHQHRAGRRSEGRPTLSVSASSKKS